MSSSGQDTSVLGKRSRNGRDVQDENPTKTESVENGVGQASVDGDDDDEGDDVGPMPMPAGNDGNGVVKKKRKGM